MDPQHRIFLQVAWHAIEDAGWRPSDLAGTRTGVFAGVGNSDYAELVRRSGMDVEAHSATGLSNAMLVNRISYLLDLHGPSEPIDTACSSSLVALHRAAESIRHGECDMAIAGGVNVMLSPDPFIAFSKAGMLSEDGRCRTFDRAADGYVRAEGAGAVFLKRLDRAVADGDPIIALLRGSAVNHGGRAASPTAPNSRAQAELLVRAYSSAGVSPASVGYIEAHGTGTRLGDPVEVEGLKTAFSELAAKLGQQIPAIPYCGLGSVKTNAGHLETAAGIAGVLKVLLAMKHRQLPGNLHFLDLNQHIRLEGSPFYIVEGTRPWEPLPDENGRPVLRAGCSSFGFGGANAHVVLEAYEPVATVSESRRALVILSAKNKERLRDAASALLGFLDQPDRNCSLVDIAYTLMIGREQMESRFATVVQTLEELKERLAALLKDGLDRGEPSAALAFLRDDEDAAELLERWIRKGKLDQIARIWLAGAPVDWRRLPHPAGSRRVSLPAYPFAPDRHWFAERAALEAPAGELQPDPAETRQLALAMQPIDALESFLHRLLQHAMERMGLLSGADASAVGIKPEYERLVAALLAMLQKARLPKPQAESREELEREKERLIEDHPSVKPHLELAWICLDRYPEILTGKTPATDVLFPGSSMRLVDPVYRDNPLADFTNRLAAATIARAKPAQILELGAGTGGTTQEVLKLLAARKQSPRYVFTDISRAFIRQAQTRFGEAYPFLEFGILDIEKDAVSQGFVAGQFDVVLAANVLHATRDIGRTLGRVRSLLRPGGLLVLNEINRLQAFTTLTFGLLSGWWAYQDDERRLPHSPLLDVAGWQRALAESGFARVTVLDGNCDDGRNLQQHVFVAHADANRPVQVQPQAPAPRAAKQATLTGVEALVSELTAQCLGMPIDQLDRDMPFVDLGVDSILGIELVNRINERLSIDLPKTVLFDHPDVASLVQSILADAPAAAETTSMPSAEVAIIGMAGRFPDAPDATTFWSNLAAGRCSVRELPPDRWKANGLACRSGGFLADIDLFDPLFFNMSGLEAELSDPQQRLFLEECWNAIEDAGYANSELSGTRCGVYAGVAKGDYQVRLLREGITEPPSFWGNEGSVLAARISYFLDLRGPSVAVNTACSSSLVAVHLACQALRTGDCTIALAGGVYVGTTPNLHIMAGNAGMLSQDGVCRAFDQDANGFVPGEGVGVVVLKPLAAAQRDGDQIYAIIKGTGINQDGHTNGITAPSARAQTELECAVLEQAQVHPETIGYVETHGTGTKLGDPIEFKALTDAYRRFTARSGYCAIGSVKTNIGHAITAAGIGSLIKVLLALKHRQIPPSLNFRTPNEHLAIEGSPFYVNTTLKPWEPAMGSPRRAAISSFGFSGTNAHVIVEEASASVSSRDVLPWYLLPFSARTAQDLRHLLERFQSCDVTGVPLADVAYTLLVGRRHFKIRKAFVAESLGDLKNQVAEAFEGLEAEAKPANEADVRRAIAAWRGALGGSGACPTREQLEVVANWYTAGGVLERADLFGIPGRRRVGLPTYPFNRKRYWLTESSEDAAEGSGLVAPAPALVRSGSPAIGEQIRRMAAEVLKIDVSDLDPWEPLEHYGMDSLAAVKLGTRLQQDFGDLPPELVVTCRTVNDLSQWLIASKGERKNGSRPLEQSLAQLLAKGETEPIQAAAILAVPVNVLAAGVSREQVRQLFGHRPYWLNVLQTSLGRLGLFFLPKFDDELYLDERATVQTVLDACEMAGHAGARTVALTGLIPSATDYARSVSAAAKGRDLPAITTGHAVTSSAVVLAVERILEESHRELTGETVGFLGTGSIGAAVLMLMIRCLPHPAEILLCDVFGAEARLQELRRLLREELGYRGPVRIASSRAGVAAEIYSATLIVGATNVPNLLDVHKLNPGVLIVDDSAPHCFRAEDAIARFRNQTDLLFTEGGLLRMTEPVEQLYSVSAEMLQSLPADEMEALNWVGRDDPREVMGCMLSALLSTVYAELEPTLGLIDWRTAEQHYRKLKALGFGSAALHCEGYRLPPESVLEFGNRFSRKSASA